MRRGRLGVDDPVGAAGDGEGMRTDRHVFVKHRSPVGECRTNICSNRDDLFRKVSVQVHEKSRGVFRRSHRDFGIDMLRDLFDGKKDWIEHPMPSSGSRKITSWAEMSKM